MDISNTRSHYDTGNNAVRFSAQSHSPARANLPGIPLLTSGLARSSSVELPPGNNSCGSLTGANGSNIQHLFGAAANNNGTNVNNLYQHIPSYDAATAALLMNPSVAVAAVASVAQQIVAAQQQQHVHQHQQQPPLRKNTVDTPAVNFPMNMNPPNNPVAQNMVNGNPSVVQNVNQVSSVPTQSIVHQMTVGQPDGIHPTNNNINLTSSSVPGNSVDVNQALAVLSNAGLINTHHGVHHHAHNNATINTSNPSNSPPATTNNALIHRTPSAPPMLAPAPIPANCGSKSMLSSTSNASNINSASRPKPPSKKKPATPLVKSSLSTNFYPQVIKTTVPRMPTTMISSQHLASLSSKNGPAIAMNVGNPLESMRSWTLKQLENHIRLLRESSQPVPQPLALLLADARRKEDKRTAKRVANRKSACTSRARKKALVEEMTRTNAKLRRQALILSLLPDLVLAVTVEGEITFCSAQVERVLRHRTDDLVGSNLMDLLLPASKDAMSTLINVLVTAERNEREKNISNTSSSENNTSGGGDTNPHQNNINNNSKNDNGNGGNASSGGSSMGVAVISEQSFPPSVVKVMGPENSKTSLPSVRNGINNKNGVSTVSRSSGSGASNNMAPNNSSRSNSSFSNNENSSSNQSGSDEDNRKINRNGNGNASNAVSNDPNKNGTGASRNRGFSVSEDLAQCKQLQASSDALNRNVQYHKDHQGPKSTSSQHKDDVTGASVTVNNAGARLSSLEYNPLKINIHNANAQHQQNQHPIVSLGTNRGSTPTTESTASNCIGDKITSTSVSNINPKKRKSSRRNNGFCHQENIEEQYNSSESDLSRDDNRVVASNRRPCNENNEDASEDSGYREEDRSREESGSSGDESTNSLGDGNARPKPLAPTCNICLIRDDLTTIWCEVTSSIRTRSLNDEMDEFNPVIPARPKIAGEIDESKQIDGEDVVVQDVQVKELLLCLRPIREGDEKVSEKMRFEPRALVKNQSNNKDANASTSSVSAMAKVSQPQQTKLSQVSQTNHNCASTPTKPASHIRNVITGTPVKALSSNNVINPTKRPVKKRPFSCTTTSTSNTGKHTVSRKGPCLRINSVVNSGNTADSTTATEKSVVESLMLMWNKKSS